jgi:hypothetical protein
MRHEWEDTELWGTKALKCVKCQLHIVDYPMLPAVKAGGKLHFALSPEMQKQLAKEGYGPFDAKHGYKDEPLPEGEPVRYQSSNVLSVDWRGKTRDEIIAYAEDPPNRNCVGVREPAKSAFWKKA